MKQILQKIATIFLVVLAFHEKGNSQDFLKGSEVHGSFQADGIYYLQDSKLGITSATLDGRVIRMNGFTEVNYSLKNFTAGMRFEAYLPPLLGYDAQNQGLGIPYWYAQYRNDFIDITAGNFYEQFGQGMMFRTYQEWTLGYDNSLKGIRVIVTPYKGVKIKGVYGVQRYYWEVYKDGNRGIVKGLDGDFFLNDMVPAWADSKTKLSIGGTFVSDFQKDKTVDVVYNGKVLEMQMPQNVACYGGRFNFNLGGFNLNSEFAHKIPDPSALNDYIYKPGNALFASASYSVKGLGIDLTGKWLDNMSYKSDRAVQSNMLNINYLPAITKEHTYALPSMYPYATQPLGEAGISATLTHHFKKSGFIGGKNGLTLALNYSQVNSIKQKIAGSDSIMGQPGTLGYATGFLSVGNELYYRDINIEVTKKFSHQWKGIFTYLNQAYNKLVVEGHADKNGNRMINSNIGVADITWNITSIYSLRGEVQGLFTKQDKGNWAAALLEFTISPAWFFSVADQWNYGNSDASQRLHYFLISAGYTLSTTRIALSFGRQREGIICVGGVCRYVPASTGFTLTVTSNF